jgi:hypothetical protein
MKVLTSDAVQDPTKVEAKVRREVAMRKHGHEKMNQERKLTDDQRREKIENKKADEEKRGIFGAVFKYVFAFHVLNAFYLVIKNYFSSPPITGSKRCRIQHTDIKCARTPSN